MRSLRLYESEPPNYLRTADTRPFGWLLGEVWFADGSTTLSLEVGYAGFQTHYPVLRKGDVVPMFGFIYKVKSIDHNRTQSAIYVRWLDKDELPRGLAVTRGSLIVPLYDGRRGLAVLGEDTLRVTQIDRASDGKSPTAAVTVFEYKTLKTTKTTVHKGDALAVGGKRQKHQVLNVVPPDATAQVIGWIEVDGELFRESVDQIERIQLHEPAANMPFLRYDFREQGEKEWLSGDLGWVRGGLQRDGQAAASLVLRFSSNMPRFFRVDPESLSMRWRHPQYGYTVSYPAVSVGWIVPTQLGLFRVARVEGGMELERVDDAKLLARAGQATKTGVLVVAGGEAKVTSHVDDVQRTIAITKFTPDTTGDGVTATVVVTPGKEKGDRQTADVRVGDLLPLGHVRHKVLRIVPPDEKAKIVGWLEIADKPGDQGGSNRKSAAEKPK